MSFKHSLKRVGREIARPFKRLAKKGKAKFQRSVLKTIERNPGIIQAIVAPSIITGGAGTPTHTVNANSNMDSLLLAFIRSSQRNQRTRTPLSRLSSDGGNVVTLATFQSSCDLLSRSEDVADLLSSEQRQRVVLHIYDNDNLEIISRLRGKFLETHQSQLYVAQESGSDCICLFERKAA
jgi:hypothetical protein